jgi:DNA-binding NarL/FixJ family response regulator
MLDSAVASTRVLLVAQNPAVSVMARAAIAREPSLELTEVVSSPVEATRVARATRPALAVCDTTLPDPGSIELARFFRLRLPDTVVVFMSPAPTEDELFEAVRVGVAAYLHAGSDTRLVSTAFRRAAQGEFLIDEEVIRRPNVASRILSYFRMNPPPSLEGLAGHWPAPTAEANPPRGASADPFAPLYVPLSPREIEVLDLVARGNSNKLIARQLGISDQTVKNHITTILRRLEVNDRTEAVVYALRNGWIRVDTPAASVRR